MLSLFAFAFCFRFLLFSFPFSLFPAETTARLTSLPCQSKLVKIAWVPHRFASLAKRASGPPYFKSSLVRARPAGGCAIFAELPCTAAILNPSRVFGGWREGSAFASSLFCASQPLLDFIVVHRRNLPKQISTDPRLSISGHRRPESFPVLPSPTRPSVLESASRAAGKSLPPVSSPQT